MKYQILQPFRVRTGQGEHELLPGQIVSLADEKALKLLSEGKISPVERVAYRVFSEALQAFLWIVDTDEGRKALQTSEKVTEAIYTADEVRNLKGVDRDGLKAIQAAKEVFQDSKVERVTRDDSF